MRRIEDITSGQWDRIKQIFAEAVELSPAEREVYLARECGADAQLRAEIESLLAEHDRPGSFLAHGAVSGITRTIKPRALQSKVGLEDRFLPGAVFDDRFRIISLVGQGGMGEVYRAHDLQLNQTIALKFMPLASRDALERFRNEVRTARQVTHPNVCRVFDIGETRDAAYFTMEYIDGEDLASLLLRIGRLSEDKGIEIAQQICAGLHAAHEKGILHRDLKPGNIMLDGRGQAHITDFGLAALAETVQGREAGHGTPLYMAPEQLVGKEATARSDIYALGLILFEMFTGRPPFDAHDPDQLRELRVTTPVPHPSNAVAGIAPSIERTILRCLEVDPRSRPASALSVASGLAGKNTSAASITTSGAPLPADLDPTDHAIGVRRSVALLLLLFACLGMPLVALWGNHIGWISRQQLQSSPETLAQHAKQLAVSLGYGQAVDATWGFLSPREVKSFTPRTVQFWYRQANCVFEPDRLIGAQPTVVGSFLGVVTPDNPRDACAGDVNLFFDLKGRLVGLRGVPSASHPGSPDWNKLLDAAGLSLANLRSVAPDTAPVAAFDEQQRWIADSGDPAEALPVQARSLRGVPVYFTVGDDIDAGGMPSRLPPRNKPMALPTWTPLVISSAILISVLFLVRHNLLLHRGDRRGAFLIARFMFCLSLLAWGFGANHRATFTEGAVLMAAIGWALTMSAAVWLFYVAIDPYIRRRWPHTLTSMHLILDGNIFDPLVARDILAGMAAGVGIAILYFLRCQIDENLGGPPPLNPIPSWLDGWATLLPGVLFSVETAVWAVFVLFTFLFLLRILFRRTWIAGAVYVLMFTGNYIAHTAHPLADLPVELAMSVLILVVLLRGGAVPSIVSHAVASTLFCTPITFDFSKWYAIPSLVLFAALCAAAVGAYRLALPKGRFFRDEMLYR